MFRREKMSMSNCFFTSYGFLWDKVQVERLASSDKPRKFWVLRVTTPNKEIIDIQMTPKKTTFTK